MAGEAGDKQIHRTRINSTYMGQNHGKQVCLIGTVTKCDGGGQSFTVKATDGGIINVRMRQQPLTEPLTGMVEVCGMGQGKNLIVCDSYVSFPEEMQAIFDPVTYNEMVVLVNTVDENPWKPL